MSLRRDTGEQAARMKFILMIAIIVALAWLGYRFFLANAHKK